MGSHWSSSPILIMLMDLPGLYPVLGCLQTHQVLIVEIHLLLFKKKKNYLFLAVLGPCCCKGFSLAGTPLWLGRSGFCHCGARALGTQASVIVARGLSSCSFQALECQLNICGEQALLLHSIWDLPGSGVKPVSPTLTGRFFTTEPPGKPSVQFSRSVVSDSL